MRTKVIGWATAVTAVLTAATAWGLAVSVGVSDTALRRTRLPDGNIRDEMGARSVVATAAWGAGDGQIGVDYEGEARGPDGLAVDDAGRVYVLDGVNSRILRFERGMQDASYSLPDRSFRDIVVSRGQLAALSPHDDRRLVIFSVDSTTPVSFVSISPEVGTVRRLHVDGNDVCVEVPSPDGMAYHAVCTLQGVPYDDATQSEARSTGTPTSSGARIRARKVDENNLSVDVTSPDGKIRKLRGFSARKISAVLDVFGDNRGNTFVVYAVYADRQPASEGGGRLIVAKYSREGELLGRIQTSDSYTPEPRRKFALSESGDLYQLAPSHEGVSVFRWLLVPISDYTGE